MKNNLLYHSQRLRPEYHIATADTSIASAPIADGPAPMPTFPEAPLSDTPEKPSIFLSTLPSYKPVEEPNSVPYYAPSDFPPSGEPSILSYPIPNDLPTEEPAFPYELPTEVATLVLHYEPNNLSPSGEPSSLPSPIPTDHSPPSAPSDSPIGYPSSFLSQTQLQCSRKPPKSLKWPFLSLLPALLMQMKPRSSNWSPWIFLYMLLPPIPLTYLLPMSTFWHLIRNCSIKSRASFRTTTCTSLLWNISHLIPLVFPHPSHLTFHHKGLPQLQLIPTGTLQVR